MLGTFVRLCLLVLPAWLLAASAAVADEPKSLGTFKDWDAFSYTEGGNRICYMVSVPLDTKPDNVRRGDVYAMVTHRPGDEVSDEVSLIAGYPYKEGSDVEITIGGDTYELFTSGENAWTREASDDKALVNAMIRGVTMIVQGTSSRGTLTSDTYSLTGFTAAHEAIDVACNVK